MHLAISRTIEALSWAVILACLIFFWVGTPA